MAKSRNLSKLDSLVGEASRDAAFRQQLLSHNTRRDVLRSQRFRAEIVTELMNITETEDIQKFSEEAAKVIEHIEAVDDIVTTSSEQLTRVQEIKPSLTSSLRISGLPSSYLRENFSDGFISMLGRLANDNVSNNSDMLMSYFSWDSDIDQIAEFVNNLNDLVVSIAIENDLRADFPEPIKRNSRILRLRSYARVNSENFFLELAGQFAGNPYVVEVVSAIMYGVITLGATHIHSRFKILGVNKSSGKIETVITPDDTPQIIQTKIRDVEYLPRRTGTQVKIQNFFKQLTYSSHTSNESYFGFRTHNRHIIAFEAEMARHRLGM